MCFVVLCTGCGTTKTIKTKEETAISSVTQASKLIDEQKTTNVVDKSVIENQLVEENSLIQFEKETGEFEGSLIIYDTSLAVDEKTGKPPTKSKLTWTNKKNTEKTSNQSSKTSENENKMNDLNTTDKSSLKQKSKNSTNLKAKNENSAKKKTSPNVSLILLLFFGVCVIVFCVYKKITPLGIFLKIKTLFIKSKKHNFP